MPLIDKETVKCVICGTEYKVTISEWTTSDEDPNVFHSPPCPGCLANGIMTIDSYFWHNEIYTKQVIEESELPPIREDAPPRILRSSWEEPDHESPQALHMELIGQIGTELGIEQANIDTTPPDWDYEKKPDPKKTKLREWIDRQVQARNRTGLRTKQAAEDKKLEAEAHAGIEMANNTEAKKLRVLAKGNKRKDVDKPIKPKVQPETKPIVDLPGKRVHNKPEGKEENL